jgi:hypothetical protein
MKLNQMTGWFSVLTIAGCVLATLPAEGQLGGFGAKVPGVAGGAAVNGGAFLKQLSPGAADFAKAYSLYYEGLGDSDNATKLATKAKALSDGGDQFDKAAHVLMEGARTNIQEILKQKKDFDDQARAKFSDGNKAYREGVVKWTVVSAAVSDVLAKNPKAALTNPDLALAATACVKGLGEMTKFVGVMEKVSKAKREANK